MIQLYTLQNASPAQIFLEPEQWKAAISEAPYSDATDSCVPDSGATPPDATGPGAAPPLWINLVNPTAEERAAIGKRYNIPRAHLEAALDANERPRVENDGSCILIVARTPFRHDPVRRVTYSTCPIAAIFTRGVFITVCLKDGIAENLLSGAIRGSGSNITGRLALTMLLRVSSRFIEQLQAMDEEVGHMEQALKESMQNQELVKMLHLEKSLIYFLTALKGNQSVMEKIRSGTPLGATSECAALLDDVLIENKQATDMAEIYTQIMGSLSDAFGAIVSNNLNKVMKVLTGLTIVFMIPSIVGALYGMNVALPFADSPYAFAALCAACLGFALAVFLVLRKKDWV